MDGLVAYATSAVGVAAVVWVIKWLPWFRKAKGEKYPPTKAAVLRALALALGFAWAFAGTAPPLGEGVPGLIGAGALVAILSMAGNDVIKAALKKLRQP